MNASVLLSPAGLLLVAFAGNAWLVTRLHLGFFPFVRDVYFLDTLLVPAVMGAVGAGHLYAWWARGRSSERRSAAVRLLVMAALLFGARVWATYVEPRRLVLRTERLETAKARGPIRLLHISDVQSDAVGAYEAEAFARMAALEPDLVIHTGDLLHPVRPATVESELPKLRALFQTLHPPGGLFGVDGDVDGLDGGSSLVGLAGLRRLAGEEAVVDLRGTRIRILGLDLRQSRRGHGFRPLVERWLAGAGPDDVMVLAGHAPDYALEAQELPVDLCLAGHTHGGQIRLPFLGPILTLSKVPRDWARGFRTVGRTRLNVSAGVGNEHHSEIPAIRVGCPTEMTLIELTPPPREAR